MKTIALAGLGHTHLEVVRRFRERPPADTRIVCLSDSPVAAYSGMLPAVLAGQAPESDWVIDLAALCEAPHIELIVEPLKSLSADAHTLTTESGRTVEFNVASLDVGSTPAETFSSHPASVSLKPMQTFLDRLRGQIVGRDGSDRITVVLVGGGAGGVELAYTLPEFVRDQTDRECDVWLVEREGHLLPGLDKKTGHNVADELRERGVRVRTGTQLAAGEGHDVTLPNGQSIEADVLIELTGAAGPAVLKNTDLPLSDDGFVEIDDTLQVVTGGPVFAVGDCATNPANPWPKSGVYAVRQAGVLADNLKSFLFVNPLKDFKPQKAALKLFNRGDGTAWGVWHDQLVGGKWVYQWKKQLDRRHVKKYQKA